MNLHIELEFQIVFTVVLALALCAAGWRYVRFASRRREGLPKNKGSEDDT